MQKKKSWKARISALILSAVLVISTLDTGIVLAAETVNSAEDVTLYEDLQEAEGAAENVSDASPDNTEKADEPNGNDVETASNEETSSEEKLSEETPSEEKLSEETSSAEKSNEETSPEETAPKETASVETPSTEPASEELPSAENSSTETPSEEQTEAPETEMSESLPTETLPEESEQETTQEEELLLSEDDTDYIDKNTDGNIKWILYKSGKFVIEGDSHGGNPVWDGWKVHKNKITSAVVNISGNVGSMTNCMFAQCRNLKSVDLSGLNTGTATDMFCMFSECESLESIDLSGFDTSSVTNMGGMFMGCKNLKTLDLSSFDTSKVGDMHSMFSGCSSLTSLNINSFDTSKVTDISFMFSGCSSLTSLDISNFNTGNVTEMLGMFKDCSGLSSLDVSTLDTGKVTSFNSMFSGCSSLTSMDISMFDTGKAVNMEGMFTKCSSLTSLDLSSLKMVRNDGMLSYCTSLTYIYAPKENDDRDNLPVSSPDDKWYMENGMEITVMYGSNISPFVYRSDYPGGKPEPAKQNIFVSGITVAKDKVYDAVPFVPYSGTPAVADSEGRPVEGITLSDGIYTGTLADGSVYAETTQAPTQAGKYKLSFTVGGGDADKYRLKKNSYSFQIKPQTVTITAPTLAIGKGEQRPDLTGLTCTVDGLIEGDKLITEPSLKYSEENISVFGDESYRIIPYGAEAGSNYYIRYVNGKLSIELMEVPGDNPDDKVISREGVFGKNISWKLAKSGKLTIEGKGNGKEGTSWPWLEYTYSIKSAVVNVSGLTTTAGMFANCGYMESIDLSGFDTSKVKSMKSMFSQCTKLKTLDLSSFNTGNVTNMSWMFYRCLELRRLDVSSFDTHNVTDMSQMFDNCERLQSLNLKSFDTSNVTTMENMFDWCCELKRLDIGSGFKTGSVTDMRYMFHNCNALTALDVSGFDTGNVKNMYWMFCDCFNLAALDVSGFNTSSVTSMDHMFSGCRTLKSLDVRSFDTSNVTSMGDMFNGCSSLKNLDVSGFNTSSVTNMYFMFSGCSGLASLDINSFDTSNVKDMKYMFSGCASLKNLDISGLDMGNVTDMSDMFSGCISLADFDGNYLNTGNVRKMNHMFGGCTSLKSFDMSCLDMSGVSDISAMFSGCTGLISLDMSSFDMGSTQGKRLMDGCSELSCIAAPLHVNSEVKLPADKNDIWYYKGSQTRTTTLPRALEQSVVLCRNDYPGKELDTTKQPVFVSGVAVDKNKVYDGTPCPYSGTPCVVDMAGTPVSGIVLSEGIYTGTLSDGSAYQETAAAPTQAGAYELSFTVTGEDADKYHLKRNVYSFNIRQKDVTVTAPTLSIRIKETLPNLEELDCEVSGLLEGDELTAKPMLKYSADNIQTSEAGSYKIIPYGASAGNNYMIKYVAGTLTIGQPNSEPSEDSGDDSPYEDSDRIDLETEAKGAITAIAAKTYDGTAQKPAVKVTVTENKKKKTLTEGTDYRVVYVNNTDAGEGTVIVRGNGIYKGQLTKTFTIKPKPVNKLKFITGSMSVGDAVSDASVFVYDGSTLLHKGTDYMVSADGNVTAKPSKGVAVTIKGAGNYTGSKSVKIAVYASGELAKNVAYADITLAHSEMPYTGKAVNEKNNEPAVTIGTTTLTRNKDYKVQYLNNKNAGTAFVIITGKKDYVGKAVASFEITPLNLEDGAMNTSIKKIADKTYNGKLQKPAVKVTAGNKTLKNGKDYTVRYTANLHAGTASVIVTGKGNYAGTAEQEFTIKQQDIKKVTVKGTRYKGLTITYGNRRLKEGTDYTLSYGKKMKNTVAVTINALPDSDFKGSVVKKVREK